MSCRKNSGRDGTGRFSAVTKAIAATFAALAFLAPAAQAKTPGKTYCFNGICHRVNTLQEMDSLVGKDLTFKTSFYDDCKRDRFNPCGLTSSGEVFRANDADNAASPIYPNGTVLLLRNPSNGQAAVVRVNNAGPYWGKRKLDVSKGTADKLGFKKRGVANLEVRVIAAPSKAEAKYKKNRRYEAVPGPIGSFASLEAATGRAMIAMGKAPARATQVASADQISEAGSLIVDASSPAEALKAEARRFYGIGNDTKRISPSTMTAEIAPIHRARQQYTVQ
ncbi:MAG: septal ring lytic transglycosylase RlpA family protein [Hyphomicrobium sp.]